MQGPPDWAHPPYPSSSPSPPPPPTWPGAGTPSRGFNSSPASPAFEEVATALCFLFTPWVQWAWAWGAD